MVRHLSKDRGEIGNAFRVYDRRNATAMALAAHGAALHQRAGMEHLTPQHRRSNLEFTAPALHMQLQAEVRYLVTLQQRSRHRGQPTIHRGKGARNCNAPKCTHRYHKPRAR